MSPPQTPTHPALIAIQTAWNAGARSWNVDDLCAIYADDALFFGGRPGHSVGNAAIRDYFESYRGVILSASLALIEQQVLELGDGCVLAQGYADFGFVLAGGQQTRSRLRTTLLIERAGSGWRVRQHHFSSPPAEPPLGQSASA